MHRTESGLWVADGFSFLRMRATERLVTLKDGRRAKDDAAFLSAQPTAPVVPLRPG